MGEDSCSRGCGFESWHCILDGHVSHWFVEKLCCLFEKTENKWKRGRGWPFLLKCRSKFDFRCFNAVNCLKRTKINKKRPIFRNIVSLTKYPRNPRIQILAKKRRLVVASCFDLVNIIWVKIWIGSRKGWLGKKIPPSDILLTSHPLRFPGIEILTREIFMSFSCPSQRRHFAVTHILPKISTRVRDEVLYGKKPTYYHWHNCQNYQ